MRRNVLFILLVAALVVAAAAPVGAAKAVKTSNIIAECDGTPIAPPERVWETGQDGIHLRNATNQYVEWLLEDGVWREIGTNTTHANGNARLPTFEGPFWGTFDFRDDGTLGDFEGTWSWGNTTFGRASGKSADGKLVKVTLGLNPAGYPPPPGEGCLLTEFLVINPHG